MKNKHGHTPQEAARAQVLDMIEALAQADEDRNPYVETPSFNASKRKYLARLYYKLKMIHNYIATLLTLARYPTSISHVCVFNQSQRTHTPRTHVVI